MKSLEYILEYSTLSIGATITSKVTGIKTYFEHLLSNNNNNIFYLNTVCFLFPCTASAIL